MPPQSAIEYVAGRFLRLFSGLPLRGIVHLVASEANFTDYFVGFEKNRAVQGMMVNKRYLSSGSRRDIYLDVIHELCHVKQHMQGIELFDPRFDYVDRPTEIEAYRYAVQEAKRLGLSADEIRLYLKTEMMSTKALEQLIRNMGVDLEKP